MLMISTSIPIINAQQQITKDNIVNDMPLQRQDQNLLARISVLHIRFPNWWTLIDVEFTPINNQFYFEPDEDGNIQMNFTVEIQHKFSDPTMKIKRETQWQVWVGDNYDNWRRLDDIDYLWYKDASRWIKVEDSVGWTIWNETYTAQQLLPSDNEDIILQVRLFAQGRVAGFWKTSMFGASGKVLPILRPLLWRDGSGFDITIHPYAEP
jgi:hypothetical protein